MSNINVYQRCSTCVMDNNGDNNIYFDSQGVCNYCKYAIKRKDSIYFPNEIGQRRLSKMLIALKKEGKGKAYDCIMGLSGGLDSSYLAYLGHKWNLRILAFHIDDGFNSRIASRNLKLLCEKCGISLIIEKPDKKQFNDITKAFIKAGLPGICNTQDNIITSYLLKNAKKHGVKYFLSGSNFSTESILQRVDSNAADGYHIRIISDLYGELGVDKLPVISLFETYIKSKYIQKIKVLRPLDNIEYNKKKAIEELREFCGFEYYGEKHYENVLTHFAQVYYLPQKFNLDKRKSHLSSLIISKQLTREEALEELNKPLYDQTKIQEEVEFILKKLKMSKIEFENIMLESPRNHKDYPNSLFMKFAGMARKFRSILPDL